MYQKLRFGMIGGGEGAFIGQVHRAAAELDGQAQLVCGSFASDPARSVRSGMALYRLPESRCYGSVDEMLRAELALPEDVRMQFVVIVTPNHLHVPMAKAVLDAGFHVVCDKPLGVDLEEATALEARVSDGEQKFMLTHNYTGYPMIREARDLVASGALGKIRRVDCHYLQGWLATEQPGNKQAEWRTDPARSGAAGCFGDIGSHAENLASYVSGLVIESLCADLSTFVEGRALDDDGNVLIRFRGGARGTISASQIAVGKENDLTLRVFGEAGGLEWSQAEANSLIVRYADKPAELRRTGWAGTSERSVAATRLPPGHPEGYLEAFAQLYRDFYAALNGDPGEGYPTVADGVRGMRFIDRVVASSNAGSIWVDM